MRLDDKYRQFKYCFPVEIQSNLHILISEFMISLTRIEKLIEVVTTLFITEKKHKNTR